MQAIDYIPENKDDKKYINVDLRWLRSLSALNSLQYGGQRQIPTWNDFTKSLWLDFSWRKVC
jgi:hypothetical protein